MNKTVKIKDQEYSLPQEHFNVDDTRLDVELCKMGSLLLEYGYLEANARAEVGSKEAHLEQMYAIIDADIRTDAQRTGAKLTETRIKNMVITNNKYIQAIDEVKNARYNHGVLQWATTALKHKSDCLRALAYRENALIKAE